MANGPYVTGSGAGPTSLVDIFDKGKFFEPCERFQKRFWDDIEEADDVRPGGKGLTYRVIGAVGHANGNPAEGGDYSQSRQRMEVDLTVTSAQIDSTMELSSKFVEAAKDDGSFYGDAEAEGMVETGLSFFGYIDILLGAGYGTLQLGTVRTNVVTSTEVFLAADEWTFQLRPNQPVEFWLATTLEHTAIIQEVNHAAGSITLDTAGTITAAAGVFQDNVFGNAAPNGLRNIVDDDALAATIDGAARASYPYLNALVDSGTGGGVYDDLSEEMIDALLDQITWNQDLIPTQLRCNNGVFRAWKKLMKIDRTFMLSGKEVVAGVGGVKENTPAFMYGDTMIPFRIDRNLPARQLFALYLKGFRKHTLRAADWFSEKGGAIFDKVPSSNTTYKYAYIGAMMADLTISCRKYNSNGLRKNIKDASVGDV